MERDVADDAVALVEDRQDGDALSHRGYAGLVGRTWNSLLRRDLVRLGAAIASGERKRRKSEGCGTAHAYSGIHGS